MKDKHNAEIERLEKAWPQYKDASHHSLSQLPEYTRTTPAHSLWSGEQDATKFDKAYKVACQDGKVVRRNVCCILCLAMLKWLAGGNLRCTPTQLALT